MGSAACEVVGEPKDIPFKRKGRANSMISNIVLIAGRPFPAGQAKTLMSVEAAANAANRHSTIGDPLCMSFDAVQKAQKNSTSCPLGIWGWPRQITSLIDRGSPVALIFRFSCDKRTGLSSSLIRKPQAVVDGRLSGWGPKRPQTETLCDSSQTHLHLIPSFC